MMRREGKSMLGDTIVFIKVPETNETIKVQVTELRNTIHLKICIRIYLLKDFDCEGWSMEEMVNGTYEIYTPEQEREWGTLAITIKY